MPAILLTFPAAYREEHREVVEAVPQFAFPCPSTVSSTSYFSFVLTNIEAQWTFGFCR